MACSVHRLPALCVWCRAVVVCGCLVHASAAASAVWPRLWSAQAPGPRPRASSSMTRPEPCAVSERCSQRVFQRRTHCTTSSSSSSQPARRCSTAQHYHHWQLTPPPLPPQCAFLAATWPFDPTQSNDEPRPSSLHSALQPWPAESSQSR